LLGADNKLIDTELNGNNCGYTIFAQLTGKSVYVLRNETAHYIETNCENFSKVIEAQTWVRSHYPREANSILFMGAGFSDFKDFVLKSAKRFKEGADKTVSVVWKWAKNNMTILKGGINIAIIIFPEFVPLKYISLGFEAVSLFLTVKNGNDKYQIINAVDIFFDTAC